MICKKVTVPSLRIIKIGAGYPTSQILTHERATLFGSPVKLIFRALSPFTKWELCNSRSVFLIVNQFFNVK